MGVVARFLRAATALSLVLLLVAPSAHAFLVPKYDFEAEIPALSITSKKAPGAPARQINFSIVTGAYESTGLVTGAFALINGDAGGAIRESDRFDVINTQDEEGAIGRFARGECRTIQACAVERTFTGGNLTLNTNTTLIIYSETETIHHTVSAPFGLGVFVNASQALKNGPLGNLPLNHSLLLVGEDVTLSGRVAAPTDSLFAVLGNPNVTVTASDAQGSQVYQGQQYLFRFYGTPSFLMTGKGVGSPFVNGTQGTFRRAALDDLAAGFHPELINDATRALGGKDILLKQLADGLRDLAPILNGVLLGRAADPIVNKEEAEPTDLAIVRFSRGDLVPLNSSAVLSAQTEFVLLGDQGFYTEHEGVKFLFLNLPPLSGLLWLIAAAAIVLGFVLRPMLATGQPGAFGGIRLLGLVFHGLALVIAFVLWDQEFRNFLGTSFLTIWTESSFGKGAVLTITAVLEILSFLVAGLLFGMPIRFIINSGLKLGGLKKARGVGKGVGNLATWGLGAPFIPFVLNGFVGAIIDSLQKSLGAG